MASTFRTVEKIVTGRGCLAELGNEAARLGRRALLVTGRRAMREAGILDRAIEILREAGCEASVYDDVPPEPTVDTVNAGRSTLGEKGGNLVIGLGGGSVIDVAKAIGGLALSESGCAAHFHGEPLPGEGVPIIAIPTTSGTGAEVTRNSVLSAGAEPIKQSIRGDVLYPRVALVDPELTVPLPPAVTARSGMDALTQAIEGFWSIHATPITDGLAFQAIRLIVGSLIRAYEDGEDIDAREAMSYGSLTAGMAFANARLGAVHGLAHPLGVRYGIPHGEVCAILLPHVMRLNRDVARVKYDRISHVVGGDAAEFVDGLLEKLDIPTALGHNGLKPDDFDTIVSESMPSGSLKANPKEVTEDDLRAILSALCQADI